MGKITRPAAVKLICGFISSDEAARLQALRYLQRLYGKPDFESQPIPFTFTDHYTREMGPGLIRRFVSFARLVNPETLASVKVRTNSIEAKLSRSGKRRVNIDPGYVDLAKLVLASTKDFRHRVYCGKGIFAEITLFYQDKSFRAWEWTYPDYRSKGYIDIFNKIRELYALQIKHAA